MEREVIVVTGAYGRQAVQQLGGQSAFISLIQQAGADGVEIRRELFTLKELAQLPTLTEQIAAHKLITYYSVPEVLFTAPGKLNPLYAKFQQEAQQLNARAIKFSLGAGAATLTSDQLQSDLGDCTVPILIENDQTDSGTLEPMLTFASDHASLQPSPIHGVTFDMANWLWVGQDPQQAAQHLAPYVSYCHVKAAHSQQGQWQAISVDKADNIWRHLLTYFPSDTPLGIEFPLNGNDLLSVTRYYIDVLRKA